MNPKEKRWRRRRRHLRVRKKVHGTPDRPRLSVFRSLRYIYAQLIDDESGRTLCAASTLEPKVKAELKGKGVSTKSVEAAKHIGRLLAERAKEKGLEKAVFDRSGYKYHGRIKALADAARETGLKF